jgi:hypothetical protein
MSHAKFAVDFVGLFDRDDREEFVGSMADHIMTCGDEVGMKAVLVINALLYALAQRGNEAALGALLSISDK